MLIRTRSPVNLRLSCLDRISFVRGKLHSARRCELRPEYVKSRGILRARHHRVGNIDLRSFSEDSLAKRAASRHIPRRRCMLPNVASRQQSEQHCLGDLV